MQKNFAETYLLLQHQVIWWLANKNKLPRSVTSTHFIKYASTMACGDSYISHDAFHLGQ